MTYMCPLLHLVMYHPMNTSPSTEPPNSVQVLQGDTPSTGNFTFGLVHDYDKKRRYDRKTAPTLLHCRVSMGFLFLEK